jgi:hypothetical protein
MRVYKVESPKWRFDTREICFYNTTPTRFLRLDPIGNNYFLLKYHPRI